jgi:hypothetical protein
MIRLQCPHCTKEISARDELAGKKVRCPVCKEVLQLPAAAPDVEPVVQAVTEEPVPAPVAPPPLPKQPPPLPEDDIPVVPVLREENGRQRDYEPAVRRPRRVSGPRGDYADCPHCGAQGHAKKVGFTWWGGALGPWMFCHVRCSECGTCYNGRTGKSNNTAIAIYTIVTFFIALVLGVIGVIASAKL